MKALHYIVESNQDLKWGLSICTAGYEEIEPESIYPTKGHAPGYYFTPEKGRILEEYQLIYVLEGEGVLETASTGKLKVQTGSMFLLFPKEWHTYRPKPQTGWKTYWIGFKGATINAQVAHGFFSKENPLFQVGYNTEILRLYRQALEVSRHEEICFQQLLAGIVSYLLGLMFATHQRAWIDKEYASTVNMDKAREFMRDKVEENISAKEIAAHVGMGYSRFRKLFKTYTGLAPSQYYLELRLQHAKELLSISELPIKEIAYQLHFQCPDYFSAVFKKKTGFSPTEFRIKNNFKVRNPE